MRGTNNNVILDLYILIIFLILYTCLQNEVVASSPSFPIQQIQDEIGDLNIESPNSTIIGVYPKIANEPLECGSFSHPSDISSVSYYSDGKHLNATLWLNKLPTDYGYDIIKRDYAIQIDVKSVYDTYSADYGSGMYWNNKSQIWIKELYQYAGYVNDFKYIERTPIPTNLIQKGNSGTNYIPLSFDLESINSPDQYRIVFVTNDVFMKDDIYCDLVDITDYFPIPPPQYNFSLSENSVFLKPGQEKTIELKIKSHANFFSTAYLSSDTIKEIEPKITPMMLSIPPNGIVTSLVKIKALPNTAIYPHTLSISSSIYPNETLSIDFKDLEGNLRHEILKSSLDIAVVVQEPLTIVDYVNNTLNSWGTPIRDFFTLITTIGGAGISGWILNKVRNKINRKNRNNNINDRKNNNINNIKIKYDNSDNTNRNKGAPF